jgi:hypothetical protein
MRSANGRQRSCSQSLPPHIGQRPGSVARLTPYPHVEHVIARSGEALVVSVPESNWSIGIDPP